MKKWLFVLLLAAFAIRAVAQVSCDPVFPGVDDDVVITYDATKGNAALVGISPVYAHMGVITSQSQTPNDWKYVATTWGVADPVAAMTPDGPNRWKKTFNIRNFFNIPQGETVLKLAFVFRNTNGSIVGRAADGGDIFYDVYPSDGALIARILEPEQAFVFAPSGSNIAVKAAASQTASLALYRNDQLLSSATGKSLETTITATNGLNKISFVASTAGDSDTSFFYYLVAAPPTVQNPPADAQLGITALAPGALRLMLHAPGKQNVYVIGDFNNWLPGPDYQLKRSADGVRWWIDLQGLPANQPVRFQYLVDGAMRIPDPLSELILDPWNDGFIPPLTFPNLPAYPVGKTNGVVTLAYATPQPFVWEATNYQRPDKTNLIVYELLVRDFVARHDYQTLLDTLDYLQRLGVNAIELMPVNEFDGNISWGYNPGFHKALDKYYGSPEHFKLFVDACHQRNIAVIVDVVYNHVTGLSPLAQLYWDAANNRPAADNPWLNPAPKHDFNVFNDMNHESLSTREYVKNSMRHWLEEYRVDGFRFDLSKGFTQKNTVGNIGAWNAYDASRIAILKEYADFLWAIDPEFYVILEHFADNSEEKELAEYGMMIWGNMWGAYKDVGLGFAGGVATSLMGISHKHRNWNVPHLIGYMESHDEDRIGFECKTFGSMANPEHNVRTLPVGMRRMEMLHNLLFTVPGPKMMWQFGEVGYDFTINYCPDGTVNNGCRTSPKPIRWDYLDNPFRRRLCDVTASLLHLRHTLDAFQSDNFTAQLGGGAIRSIALNGASSSALVVANVSVFPQTANLSFPTPGKWYEYYTGDSIVLSGTSLSVTMQPSEYRIYTDKYVPIPAGLNPTPTREPNAPISGLIAYPNPAGDHFYLSVYAGQSADLYLQAFDAQGRMVRNMPVGQAVPGEYQFRIECADWPQGLYLIRLGDGRSGWTSAKLLKQ